MNVEAMHTFPSSGFMGTSVRVIILILRPKNKDNTFISPYIFKAGENVINQHAAELNKISSGTKPLKSFGVGISFGVSSHQRKMAEQGAGSGLRSDSSIQNPFLMVFLSYYPASCRIFLLSSLDPNPPLLENLEARTFQKQRQLKCYPRQLKTVVVVYVLSR
jgi:hypothetical protein